jgi:uncharacterized protein with HEPN domain
LSDGASVFKVTKGAPGVDGQDFADIEAYGVERWLGELALALREELQGVDRDAFFLSKVLQDAASKCAEAMGEAAGKPDDIDPALNDTFLDLNLKLARRSRDRLSHGYYRIDLDILWNTVTIFDPENGRCG